MAYKREVYEYVEGVYRDRQKQNEADLEKRRHTAYATCPRLKEIEEKLADMGSRIASCVAHGMSAIKKLHADIESLRAEKKKILRQNGFADDYLDLQYKCPVCFDTGMNGGRLCRKCAEGELKKAAFALSSLGKTLSGQTFDNFDLSYYADEGEISPRTVMKHNLDYCINYCNNFTHGDSVLMVGGTGLGKTHLSSAIAHRLIEQGIEVCYVTAPELFTRLEKEKFGRMDGEENEEFFESEVLIIDDLGSEMTSSFTVSALFSVVNSRMNSGKSTIINTNLSQADLEETYNDKIVSRILGTYKVLFFSGSDVRLKKKMKQG